MLAQEALQEEKITNHSKRGNIPTGNSRQVILVNSKSHDSNLGTFLHVFTFHPEEPARRKAVRYKVRGVE